MQCRFCQRLSRNTDLSDAGLCVSCQRLVDAQYAAKPLRVRRRRDGDEQTLVACWCAGCGRLWPLAEVDVDRLCVQCAAEAGRAHDDVGGPFEQSHAALLDGN